MHAHRRGFYRAAQSPDLALPENAWPLAWAVPRVAAGEAWLRTSDSNAAEAAYETALVTRPLSAKMVSTLPTRRRRSQYIRANRELMDNQPAFAVAGYGAAPALAKALPRRSAAKAGGGELRNRTPIP